MQPVRRDDFQEIRAFFHPDVQLAQLGGHCGDAVGFFHPPTGDAGEPGTALREQGERRQRHGGVWNVVAVEMDAREASARVGPRDRNPVFTHFEARAHLRERFREAHIALNGVFPHAFHAHRMCAARANRPQREEVGGGRGVAFHPVRAGRAVTGVCRNGKRAPALPFDDDAEARHQVQGDVDVGFGDQLALDFHRRRRSGKRQRHQ